MKFTEVKNKDVTKLANLAKDIWFEYWQSMVSITQIYFMVNKFQSEFSIKDQMFYDFKYFFIEENDQKIGYFGYKVKEDFLKFYQIYLKKDYRYKHYGKLAFEKLKEIARENNLKVIRLVVTKQNFKAHQVFEKWGFKIVKAIIRRIGNGYTLDEYIMEYYL